MTTLRLPDGSAVGVSLRRSARARRILLQVDAHSGMVELVLPRRAAVEDGVEFARSKAGWLQSRLKEIPPRVPFRDGSRVPYLGAPIRIRHVRELFDDVWRDHDTLVVAGEETCVAGQVEGWLRTEAASAIAQRTGEKAARLGARYRRIAVRDPRTRWGSCSPRGDLSFSWRLVMAPERVLDYVVAHEVAHLEVLNHSRRFWSIVDRICDDREASRRWLRANGASLHRYGPASHG